MYAAKSEFRNIPGEKAFSKWIKQVNKYLERSLDSNEIEGIAYDLFVDGCNAKDAAYEISAVA